MEKNYYCPRCRNYKLVSYIDTAECPCCGLEFFLKDLEAYELDQILSIQEKTNLIKAFKNL